MTSVARVVLPIALAVGAVVILAGCSLPHACPAIGYINSATLTVKGQQPVALKVCAGNECATSADTQSSGLLTVARGTAASWTVQTGSATPRKLEANSLDAGGSVIAAAAANLTWKRVGGSAYCGGPMVAHATLDFG